MAQCIVMQLSHVSLKIKKSILFTSRRTANHHFNYAHFVVFVLELSSIILLTFVRVQSSHSFSCSHFSHEILPNFLRFHSFSHLSDSNPFNFLLHLIKVYLNIKLWQLIYGKWLSLLIKCIPCFGEWKFHGKCIGYKVPTN